MTRPHPTPEQAAALEVAAKHLRKSAMVVGQASKRRIHIEMPILLRAVRSYLDASGAAGLTAPELREQGCCLLCGVDCEPDDLMQPCRWCGQISAAYVGACSDCAAAGIAAGRLTECPDPCGCLVETGQTCEHCGRRG